ncbi:hypothetical protein JV173_00270 [Acholeplasma equirhinis]|uniref:reverse transcriptase domain-containing protein n=1 Tax=Acholeplasma equirhinis TaxID=555393 RepID=UPI00197AA99B|nr:reverse transcriptase domain-containing protein [Acholeplasma equirhinis]MBN3489937.1 hypothetical protein [Acholeplasma equirhinis]
MKNNINNIVMSAYNKFKFRVYYDNNLTLYKKQLIEFESKNLNSKLEKLSKFYENDLQDDNYQTYLMDRINFFPFYKKIDEKNNLELNYMINAPIEIHILDTIWTILISKKLPFHSNKSLTYANRIDVNRLFKSKKTKEIDWESNYLFEPYSNGYNLWVDNTVNEIKDSLTKKSQITLITADFKRYFYNVINPFDCLNEIIKKSDSKIKAITTFLNKLYTTYTKSVDLITNNIVHSDQILPIGLSSSKILSNLYLDSFDRHIKAQPNVLFYGRYVDDVMVIFDGNVNESEYMRAVKSFIAENNMIIELNTEKTKSFIYDQSNYAIEMKKFKLFLEEKNNNGYYGQDSEEDQSFRMYIRFEKKRLSNDYSEYSKIKEIHLKNLPLSTSLIYMNYIFNDVVYDNITINQIYLKIKSYLMDTSITKSTLWKEIFQWLHIYGDNEKFNEISNLIDQLIKSRYALSLVNVRTKKIRLVKSKLSKSYQEIKLISIAYSEFKINGNTTISKVRENLIKCKLFRRKNLIEDLIKNFDNLNEFDLNKNLTDYYKNNLSFVHLSDLMLYDQLVNIFTGRLKPLKDTINDYKKVNKKYDDEQILIETSESNGYQYTQIKTNVSEKNQNFVVGQPHIKIPYEESEILKNFDFKPTFDETVKFIEWFIMAKHDDAKLIVFPELYVYRNWINILIQLSRLLQINVTFGLQPTIVSNQYFNILISTYSYVDGKKHRNLFVTARQKNTYAYREKEWCKSQGIICKDPSKTTNFIVKNKSVWFADYVCFEVTDIWMRSLFKNLADLIVIPMLNHDTRYFDNIIQSLSRDLSCIVITSNSASWGNSSIILPKSSNMNVLTEFKGGKNYFVTSAIPIYELIKYNSNPGLYNGTDGKMFKLHSANYKQKKYMIKA